jgi:hypothetical protein
VFWEYYQVEYYWRPYWINAHPHEWHHLLDTECKGFWEPLDLIPESLKGKQSDITVREQAKRNMAIIDGLEGRLKESCKAY